MDFTAKTGAPFLLDGIVVEANNNRASGYGNHVVIRHGYGYETLHLSKYNCRADKELLR
jgi:murein DD-endopeptidase MepM/ murein hydrolase activator NlpD